MKWDLSLCLVSDHRMPWEDCLKAICSAIRGGVSVVQLREKNKPKEEVKEKAKDLLKILMPVGIPLIINDYVDLAKDLGAQGVHLGQQDCDPRDARKILGAKAILGLSIESLLNFQNSTSVKYCNYVSASPVFPTQTKEDAAKPFGIKGLIKLRDACFIPLLAIGGINSTNVAKVKSAGVDGICVVSCILRSPNPEASARQLRQIFDGTYE